jgi:flagellar hook-basal body complex protein FliE
MKISPMMPIVQGDVVAPSKGNYPAAPANSFSDELKAKIQEVDNLQHKSGEAVQTAAIQGAENIHETMITMEKAGISRQLMMKVRGKALESYQEIMRMQF